MKKTLVIMISLLIFVISISVVSAGPEDMMPYFCVDNQMAATVGPYLQIQRAGKIVAVYFYKKDSKNKSTCFGACAATWPPVVIANQAMMTAFRKITDDEEAGWKKADFGLINRGNQKQVTFRGFPLYFYSKDKVPMGADELAQGILGHKKNNLWFLVNPKNFPPQN